MITHTYRRRIYMGFVERGHIRWQDFQWHRACFGWLRIRENLCRWQNLRALNKTHRETRIFTIQSSDPVEMVQMFADFVSDPLYPFRCQHLAKISGTPANRSGFAPRQGPLKLAGYRNY